MVRRTCLGLLLACALGASACERRVTATNDELRFTRLDGGAPDSQAPVRTLGTGDTAGLTAGAPLVSDVRLVRHENGLVQTSATSRLPDGTRLQLTLRGAAGTSPVVTTVVVREGRFLSDPMLGTRGPLPPGDYRIELFARFDRDTQDGDVLRATRSGRSLRGPGVTRDRANAPVLFLTEAGRL